MDRFEHYGWPFFEGRHRQLASEADAWCSKHANHHDGDADATCRKFVKQLGADGFLNHCVSATPDVRSIALLREVFAWHLGLADFAFVMQGLGSGPIVLAGSDAQKKLYRAAQRRNPRGVCAFEPEAGSDVAAMTCCCHARTAAGP
jgi:acyl-CoA dehydrogenase